MEITEEELITKRELLELTGISYGALYRWKRMKLLPDEWFIRKSTYTGHETYLPRDKILARVAEIQSLKDSMSLEEIARRYRPAEPSALSMSASEIAAAELVAPQAINQYLGLSGREGDFTAEELLELYIFAGLLDEGRLSRQEAYEAAAAAIAAGSELDAPALTVYRKFGVSFNVLSGEMQKVICDNGMEPVARVSVGDQRRNLNTLMKKKGILS